MMSFRVLVSDSLAKEGLEIFQRADGIEVDDRAGIEREALIDILPDYDALVVRSRTKPDASMIEAGTRLKVIGRAGIGVDNVDRAAATRAGVVVMNTPEGNATTTAEHTLALMMSMARHVPQATASMKAGRWEKKKFMGRELCGLTLGVIGLGNIGRIVADRALGLRMKVAGHDPYFDAEEARKIGVEWLSFAELLRRSDVITVHTPVNDETRGMISAAQIDAMKPGVMLINCARGGIYDEQALLAGLESGKIASLALDVYSEEPPPADHPLVGHPRVVCTPHVGASTQEAQVQVAVAIAEQIVAFAAGEAPKNAVNMPRIPPSDFHVVAPYMDLAERLGSFCAQRLDGGARRIEVEVHGEVAERPTAPIVSAAVAGVLKHALDRPVNAINARVLAQERGLKIRESHSTRSEKIFASFVRVTVEGAETHTVAGAIFADNEGRMIEVDGLLLEALPRGWMLVIHNRDRPGVIGHVGRVLGEASINIARMQLSLDSEADEALSLVSIDERASPEVLAALATGDVLAVRQVHL
jgi:D-3-phosphoglycerate dehydrogenase